MSSRIKVVGIGASAGGLDAFHDFFQNMPANSGMAFVVILHLPIDRKSMLAEILGRWTPSVYVPPPHAIAVYEDGRLRIRIPKPDFVTEYRPIDGFFDSLAAALREDAVGVVLSGTGSDGALGLKAIKQCGGLTIAQGGDGGGPQFEGMPASAIATGVVDLVAPATAMPAHLLRLRDARIAETPPSLSDEEINAQRLEICAILRTQLGHDFSGYKDKTFMRRVQRRMQVLNIDVRNEYVSWLERHDEEVVLLFRDLLIRVTSFFRDSDAFDVLERLVMPRVFTGKHADGTIRVWVPGCATGEEAYSLAILLREQMDKLKATPKVQIFGTDIDEPAITTARLGRYPATLLEGLSPERRQRFFHTLQSGYIVSREIRDLCTFSPHSIVRDPPFSRMDMISCRNLLIYMDTDLQADVIPAFHYAFVPGGILVLGISESTSRHEALFEPLDKDARIFIRRGVRSPPLNLTRKNPDQPLPRAPQSLLPQPQLSSPRPVTKQEASQSLRRGQDEHQSVDDAARPNRSLLDKLRGGLPHGSQTMMEWLSSDRAEDLHQQLLSTQTQLQSITEDHGTALEELRSANEELHSVNEELQSTNEELETSKEGIQSVNEELQTVNARLSEKVDELDRANSDLRNLFDSTQIATVFLDRDLIIRGFTPAVGAIYNLIPIDQGRPLTDIASRVQYQGLRDDVRHVLDTLRPLERRITRDDGQAHYLMRILPYRAPDSTVSGTVVTFLDVTTIVQAEQHHRLLVDELNHRVKNMLTVVISLAAQTLRRSATLAFMGRMRALTASYSLLTDRNWSNVSLRDVLVVERNPYVAPDRVNITMEGPDVRLGPAGALALGMTTHELLANAVKYGALSAAEGSVAITWHIEPRNDREELVLEWVEENGPSLEAPAARGFGTTLIQRSFAHDLGGDATLDFDVKGVRATLRAPLGALITTVPSAETRTQK